MRRQSACLCASALILLLVLALRLGGAGDGLSLPIGAHRLGESALPSAGAARAWSRVHVHLIAVGDSLTEGVVRLARPSRVLGYAPYTVATLGALLNDTAAPIVASVSAQRFAFKGSTTTSLADDVRRRMAELRAAEAVLIRDAPDNAAPVSPAAAAAAAASSDEAPALLARVPSPAKLRADGIDHVVVVCAVLGGTNDLLIVEGSEVSRTRTTPITQPVATAALVGMAQQCVEFAADGIARLRLSAAAAADGPRAAIAVLPIAIPPLAMRLESPVMERLAMALNGHRPSVRVMYGYCFTSNASVNAMLAERGRYHAWQTAPAFAQAVGAAAEVAARFGEGTSSQQQRPQLWVRPTAIDLDGLFDDRDVSLWTDCIHFSVDGYRRIGVRVAEAVRETLLAMRDSTTER